MKIYDICTYTQLFITELINVYIYIFIIKIEIKTIKNQLHI